MTNAVLDASALLAFVNREAGFDVVQEWMSGSIISSVNYAETLQKLVHNEHEQTLVQAIMSSFRIAVIEFDREHAEQVASIYSPTQAVSLADRACLALGMFRSMPIVTADRQWKSLDIDAEIILFRPKAS